MPHTFAESVDNNTALPTGLLLPLCHVAPCDLIFKYIENGAITPPDDPCDVFHRRLNYFFYGRAAYRPRDPSATGVTIAQPASIIIRPSSVSRPFTVYPFDTGAFPRYANHSGGLSLNDFALTSDMAECERLIERHWHSHSNYIDADLAGFRYHVDADCGAVERYSKIARDITPDTADNRRSSLEITDEADVPVGPANIVGLVVPKKYAARASVMALKAAGVKVATYRYDQEIVGHHMAVVVEDSCRIVDEWFAGGSV